MQTLAQVPIVAFWETIATDTEVPTDLPVVSHGRMAANMLGSAAYLVLALPAGGYLGIAQWNARLTDTSFIVSDEYVPIVLEGKTVDGVIDALRDHFR